MALTDLHWLVPGHLAGSARPGLLAPLGADLDHAASLGFTHIVTLTEQPLPVDPTDVPDPLVIEHFPIDDMGFPTPRAAAEVCARANAVVDAGGAVLFHCKAGLGRTGLMLAGCLVLRGDDPDAAIVRVRTVSPRSIQTRGQEMFLRHLHDHLAAAAGAPTDDLA